MSGLAAEFERLVRRRRNGEVSAQEYVEELDRIAEDTIRLLEEQGRQLEEARRRVEELAA